MTWRDVRLADVSEVGPRDPALPEDAPFVPMAAVEVGRRHPTSYERRGSRGGIRARANDVLFARITPCLENGKLAQLPADAEPTGGSTEFIVARAGPELDPGFLYYWCASPAVRDRAESLMTGTTGRMRFSGTELADFRMQLPPLEEQRRIVELLEDHLSRLDAAAAYLLAARRRSEAMVMSSMAHAVAAASRTSPTSSVGAEAELVEYGTSAKCGDGGSESPVVPVLRMGNLKHGEIIWDGLKYLEASHSEFPKLILAPGDLLFNRTNSAELVGKAAVYESGPPASFASYLIRVRFRDSVDPRWANIAINSPQGRAYVRSVASQQVGQANVNGKKLKAFPLPLPSIDHQMELIAAHDAVLAAARRLDASVSLSVQHLAALRRALLAAAFSGRLTGDREAAGA